MPFWYDLNEIKKAINANNTVLVVWDVQEALVNNIFDKEEFIRNLKELIEFARKKNIQIFYTMITPLPDRFNKFRRSFNPGDIYKEVYPKENDIVIRKNTASIFEGTSFDLMLRNGNIQFIIFTGIATEIGVETSARHAQVLGYIPIIAKDCVSSSNREAHERSLKNMEILFPVLSNKEIFELF